LLGFIRRRLSRKVLTVLTVSVILVMLVVIYVTASHQTEIMISEMERSAEYLASTIYAGIKHPMAVGDSGSIEKELSDVKEERKGLEIFICDFNQGITYATHKEKIKSKLGSQIFDKNILLSVSNILKTGEHSQTFFEKKTPDGRYLLHVHPILNHKDCYHCHGSSRKILGGMVIKMDAGETYASIASVRNRTIIMSIFGIFAIIALTYTMLTKLVRHPVESMAERAKKFAEGDMSVSVDVKTEDEIGVLGTTFNDMVKKISSFSRELELKVEDRTALLNEKTHLLEIANKELEAFAYSVSHDLRAPLRSVDGFSKILIDEYSPQLDDRCKHYLRRIREGTSRMSVLIDDMLALSRAGRTELQMRLVKFGDIVNNVLNDFREEIKSRGISIKIGDLPARRCDSALMQAVFSNLISNAIRFTREKERTEIEIGFDEEKDAIFVRDNGIGFDMQYHDKIFQVFQRLHLPEEYEGTGIGLAIVKRIVDRHHGKVWAESEPGKGTTFFIRLPM
jgi:signal transduction histidine kinase